MWMTGFLGIIIVVYVIWIVRRKVRQFRQGRFCDCGCNGCVNGACKGSKKTNPID